MKEEQTKKGAMKKRWLKTRERMRRDLAELEEALPTVVRIFIECNHSPAVTICPDLVDKLRKLIFALFLKHATLQQPPTETEYREKIRYRRILRMSKILQD